MTSKRRIVVTGLGVVCASGIGMDTVWQRCAAGHNAIRGITRFNPHRHSCKVGGEVDDFKTTDFLHPMVIQQTDRSSHLGMAACKMALADANLSLEKEDPYDIGTFFSNLLGGMEFAEPELYAQTFLGANRVSAYQAVAWFYAATQGQWSIQTGIKGYGKTVVADRTGGLQSIGLAAQAIQRSHSRVVFAGGFEAPLVPYAFLMYETTGLLCKDRADPMLSYRPFHHKRNGLVLGEGSGILVLEDLEHAQARSAPIYAELAGFSVCMDGKNDPPGSGLARCIGEVLQAANLAPSEIDHISAEGVATIEDDHAEAAAIRQIFGDASKSTTVSVPKSMFGHALAAAGAIDAALACRMIRENAILPTINLDEPDMDLGAPRLNQQTEHKNVNTVLCCLRGKQGLNTAVLFRRHIE